MRETSEVRLRLGSLSSGLDFAGRKLQITRNKTHKRHFGILSFLRPLDTSVWTSPGSKSTKSSLRTAHLRHWSHGSSSFFQGLVYLDLKGQTRTHSERKNPVKLFQRLHEFFPRRLVRTSWARSDYAVFLFLPCVNFPGLTTRSKDATRSSWHRY